MWPGTLCLILILLVYLLVNITKIYTWYSIIVVERNG